MLIMFPTMQKSPILDHNKHDPGMGTFSSTILTHFKYSPYLENMSSLRTCSCSKHLQVLNLSIYDIQYILSN